MSLTFYVNNFIFFPDLPSKPVLENGQALCWIILFSDRTDVECLKPFNTTHNCDVTYNAIGVINVTSAYIGEAVYVYEFVNGKGAHGAGTVYVTYHVARSGSH